MSTAAVQQLPPRGAPKFTNAAKLIADPCPDVYQVVSVQSSPYPGRDPATGAKIVKHMNVANVTNGHVLLRRTVENIPEGAYDVNIDGSLSPTQYKNEDGASYPHIEAYKPSYLSKFDEIDDPAEGVKVLPILCSLDYELMGRMIRLCDEVARVNGDVAIGRAGMQCDQNEQLFLAHEFNLPTPMLLNPRYLSIVLVEMIQYPSVKMIREHKHAPNFDPSEAPLFIGKSWGCCGILMPKRRSYY